VDPWRDRCQCICYCRGSLEGSRVERMRTHRRVASAGGMRDVEEQAAVSVCRSCASEIAALEGVPFLEALAAAPAVEGRAA